MLETVEGMLAEEVSFAAKSQYLPLQCNAIISRRTGNVRYPLYGTFVFIGITTPAKLLTAATTEDKVPVHLKFNLKGLKTFEVQVPFAGSFYAPPVAPCLYRLAVGHLTYMDFFAGGVGWCAHFFVTRSTTLYGHQACLRSSPVE